MIRSKGGSTLGLWFVSVAVLLVAAGFAVYGVLVQETLRQVQTNTRRIDVNQYQSCVDLNRAFTRSNSVIDSAISTETARAHPDRARIDALRKFRLPIRFCGAKP